MSHFHLHGPGGFREVHGGEVHQVSTFMFNTHFMCRYFHRIQRYCDYLNPAHLHGPGGLLEVHSGWVHQVLTCEHMYVWYMFYTWTFTKKIQNCGKYLSYLNLLIYIPWWKSRSTSCWSTSISNIWKHVCEIHVLYQELYIEVKHLVYIGLFWIYFNFRTQLDIKNYM